MLPEIHICILLFLNMSLFVFDDNNNLLTDDFVYGIVMYMNIQSIHIL